jgi:tRNA(fMet)-specific endonuclease VapC
MIYVVDTNVCINLLRNKDPLLARMFHAHPPADIVVCSVVLSELFYGAALSKQPLFLVESAKVQAFVQPYSRLPLDDESGRISASCERDSRIEAHRWEFMT